MKYDVRSTRWNKKSLFIFFSIFLLCCLFYILFKNNQSGFKVAVSSLIENETSNKGADIKQVLKDESFPLYGNDMKYAGSRERYRARLHSNVSFGIQTTIQHSMFREDGQKTYFHNHIGNTKYTYDSILVKRLTIDLKYKLKNVLPDDNITIKRTCVKKESIDNSCDGEGCLQLQLPESPVSRIKQLVGQSFLRLGEEYREVVETMGDSVPGYYDIILTTAASKNHYEESKALLLSLHESVFPYLKNFTLVFYDIGLTEDQREDISSICQCHLRKFPFPRFPKIFTRLKCYAWKPIIVRAHASHCNLLFWMDASLRFFENPSKLKELLQLATVRGLQTGTAKNKIPLVTLRSMVHFFGDEPCVYHHYAQCLSGVVILKNEPLIREAVVEPWAACAVNESCMCPNKGVDLKQAARCRDIDTSPGLGRFKYAQCHRFDQSALSIIIRKLFREKSHHIMQRHMRDFLSIKRGDKWEEDSSSVRFDRLS